MTTVIEIEKADQTATVQTATVRPFNDGAQYADWTGCNCARCNKSVIVHATDAGYSCRLEEALATAAMSDGQITLDIALRIGMNPAENRYVWCCDEVEWTAEWKAEWNAIRRFA